MKILLIGLKAICLQKLKKNTQIEQISNEWEDIFNWFYEKKKTNS